MGPSTISTPYAFPKAESRKPDSVITFVIPSVEQNRPCAKGRSFEIPRTTVPGLPAASWLNFRIAVAQVEVSRLGKIFRILFFPFSSDKEKFARSDLTSLNSGAILPLTGRFPEVFMGFPLSVNFAITFSFKFKQSFEL